MEKESFYLKCKICCENVLWQIEKFSVLALLLELLHKEDMIRGLVAWDLLWDVETGHFWMYKLEYEGKFKYKIHSIKVSLQDFEIW